MQPLVVDGGAASSDAEPTTRRGVGAGRLLVAGAAVAGVIGAACVAWRMAHRSGEQRLHRDSEEVQRLFQMAQRGFTSASCDAKGDECTKSKCCSDPNTQCFQKDHKYAICAAECLAGVHASDPKEYQTPWSCNVLSSGPAADGGTASEPYLCSAGFNNWKAGWSDAKKEWCCKNKQMGCPGDFLPTKAEAQAAQLDSAASSAPPGDGTASQATTPGGCLCLFDVDRTLTSKQSETCGKEVPGVTDTAFGGGGMRLSEVGQNVGGTACGACKLGIISAGAADGNGEQGVLAAQLGLSESFSPAGAVNSRLIFGCGNGVKQNCAADILAWFERSQAIKILPEDVYFFDDLGENIPGFANLGMNAHQISCAGRDGDIGLCGATADEIRLEKGITMC